MGFKVPGERQPAGVKVCQMARARTTDLLNDFLGSVHVLATAVSDVVEKKLLRDVAGAQLTLSQFRLLKLVAQTDAHNIGDVAAFLGVSNAAASKAVDKLVRRGLLLRSEGEPDRRAIQLSLTKSSRRLLADYDALRNRQLAKIFRQFSPRELRRTAKLLDHLSAGLISGNVAPEEICLQCGIYFREQCLLQKLAGRRCFYLQHKEARRPRQHS
ncbi:MAG TPA: MarR family transcriptional regulator [Candidatus Acidoferrales bacterium]|nr:MarR family transcriptional regulator [Candidatus Acidoferrales bacterium]